MIAVRWALLLGAIFMTLAALAGTVADLQPSALRLMVTAVVALLAPLFWPGSAATLARTALRVVAWSAAAAGLAALVLGILGTPGQPLSRTIVSCLMLMPILLVTHTVVAGLEWRWRGPSGDAAGARELAGRTVTIALALLGSLPLWLGPVAELLAGRHVWIIDAIIGASPLTHLALASGNDLLRNQWLYQHANLAALQFTYPGLAELAWSYATACSLLALVALAFRSRRRASADATRIHLATEKTE